MAAKTAKTKAKKTAAPKIIVERTSKQGSAWFSDGDTLFAANEAGIQAGRDEKSLKTITKLKGEDTHVTSLFVDGDELWAAGDRLWRSTNRGKTLTALALPKGVEPDFWGKEFHGVAKDKSGVVWAGGTWVVSVRKGKVVNEKATFGDDARVKAVVPTPYGVFFLKFTGVSLVANDGKAARATARARGHLSAACVTPSGTLIVVGSGRTWSAEIHRSEDGGKTFKPVRTAKHAPLNAVAALPDGRLVAGGGTLLLSSTNDGKTWQVVKTPADATFNVLCTHGDVVIGDGVRIR